MDIIGYHVFIIQLLSHMKIISSIKDKLFKFSLRTAILFIIFFHTIKNILIFLFNSIIENYSQKWERKKQKQKIISKPKNIARVL